MLFSIRAHVTETSSCFPCLSSSMNMRDTEKQLEDRDLDNEKGKNGMAAQGSSLKGIHIHSIKYKNKTANI